MPVAANHTPDCLDCGHALAAGERAMLFMVVGRGTAALCEACASRYADPDHAIEKLRAAVNSSSDAATAAPPAPRGR